jgi:hypothetical protein
VRALVACYVTWLLGYVHVHASLQMVRDMSP